jgi:hypothetical protein
VAGDEPRREVRADDRGSPARDVRRGRPRGDLLHRRRQADLRRRERRAAPRLCRWLRARLLRRRRRSDGAFARRRQLRRPGIHLAAHEDDGRPAERRRAAERRARAVVRRLVSHVAPRRRQGARDPERRRARTAARLRAGIPAGGSEHGESEPALYGADHRRADRRVGTPSREERSAHRGHAVRRLDPDVVRQERRRDRRDGDVVHRLLRAHARHDGSRHDAHREHRSRQPRSGRARNGDRRHGIDGLRQRELARACRAARTSTRGRSARRMR